MGQQRQEDEPQCIRNYDGNLIERIILILIDDQREIKYACERIVLETKLHLQHLL